MSVVNVDALLLRPGEAAERLGVSKGQLYIMLRRGEIRSMLLGVRARRIAVVDLEAFVERKRAEVLE